MAGSSPQNERKPKVITDQFAESLRRHLTPLDHRQRYLRDAQSVMKKASHREAFFVSSIPGYRRLCRNIFQPLSGALVANGASALNRILLPSGEMS